MKFLLLFAFTLVTALYASAQTDLFFSEYVEGSGNNKALEIYNPTNQTIDLTKYYVARFSNGSNVFTDGGITRLTGTLAPYKTFLLINGQTAATATSSSPAASLILQAMATQLDGAYPAPTYMNGNDAIALLKTANGEVPLEDMSNVTPVDLFGEIGLGPSIEKETGWSDVKDATITYNATIGGVVTVCTGKIINYIVQAKSATVGGVASTSQGGPFWMAWTKDHSLIRKPNIIKGVIEIPSPFIVNQEWDTLPAVVDASGKLSYEDIWTNLGKHVCVADPFMGLNKTQVGSSSVSVYPNPVISDRFTLTSTSPVAEVEIFSVIGKSVYKQAYNKGQQQIEVGFLGLDKGMYLVKVTSTNKNTAVKKILIK